ncbi:MAG: glycosyltransferase family 4 protein [Thermococcus sp.]|nr:glycosyltransferase family 4 protein [Thermococcus sp.]
MALAGRALQEQGHKVEICALPYSYKGRRVTDRQVRKLLGEGVTYSECWRPVVKADVAYVVYQPFFRWAIKASCPLVAGMHAIGIHYLWTVRRLVYRTWGAHDLSHYAAVRVLNSSLAVPHSRVYQIPNWIDTREWKPVERKRSVFTVLFVGRRVREKGWDTFLEICQVLQRRGISMEFWALGGDESVGPVKGLGYLTGNALVEAYSRAHLTIYPSKADTFGRVNVESCACGTPVLTTPIPAHKAQELPVGYASSVEEYVSEVMRMAELWERRREEYMRLSGSVRRAIMDKYDVSVVVPIFESMLREVAESKGQ